MIQVKWFSKLNRLLGLVQSDSVRELILDFLDENIIKFGVEY